MELPCNIDLIVVTGLIGLAVGIWIGRMMPIREEEDELDED